MKYYYIFNKYQKVAKLKYPLIIIQDRQLPQVDTPIGHDTNNDPAPNEGGTLINIYPVIKYNNICRVSTPLEMIE
jgi:hypothetical protein